MSDEPKTPTYQRHPQYIVLYANQSRLRMGPGEMVLTFGMTDDVPGVGTVIEDRIGIGMSPQHAKLLARALTEAVDQYETTHGEVVQADATPEQAKETSSRIQSVIEAALKPKKPN